MLTLLTYQPERRTFSKDFWKSCVGNAVSKQRGPSAVFASLQRGLQEIGHPFNTNPSLRSIHANVGILSGISALQWAVQAKERGIIKRIVAGPNIVVSPSEYDSLLANEAVDRIIVPSEWVKRFYETENPLLKGRVGVWAAGVLDPQAESSGRGPFVIYNKLPSDDVLKAAIAHLRKKGLGCTVLSYGSFSQGDYFSLLQNAPGLIYLSNSESQGLALHEAWIRNVPTLVYNGGQWEHDGRIFRDALISAPYLTEECGMLFSDSNSFSRAFDEFADRLPYFSPRAYSLSNFTDAICSQRYIDFFA